MGGVGARVRKRESEGEKGWGVEGGEESGTEHSDGISKMDDRTNGSGLALLLSTMLTPNKGGILSSWRVLLLKLSTRQHPAIFLLLLSDTLRIVLDGRSKDGVATYVIRGWFEEFGIFGLAASVLVRGGGIVFVGVNLISSCTDS